MADFVDQQAVDVVGRKGRVETVALVSGRELEEAVGIEQYITGCGAAIRWWRITDRTTPRSEGEYREADLPRGRRNGAGIIDGNTVVGDANEGDAGRCTPARQCRGNTRFQLRQRLHGEATAR